ncbi:nuclease homologue [Actinopolyspora alba]|uniref:Nuclease homologue n=1 Tax=Actinopolyspora alba TaxID=673379 RepID=A0A1I1TKS2_9ACTN|nr:thermonuclease family protein [Actinopolyspora alba]SFD59145.1 nuclease homologue [Actinopolyspora alba]
MTVAGILLVLIGLGVIVWSIVFALRRYERWSTTTTRRFWTGLSGGLLALLVGFVATVLSIVPAPENTAGSGNGTTAPSTPAVASSTPATSASTPPTGPTPPSVVPGGVTRAEVAGIIDGDTVELLGRTGAGPLPDEKRVEVRLLEIDAPEVGQREQCYGDEATARLRELLPVGGTVWIQRDERLRDRYDRYLLYLWNADGVFVNPELVRDGFAKAVLHRPNDKHWNTISGAQPGARGAGSGLWGACERFGQPGDTSTTERRPSPEPNPRPRPEPRPEPEPRPDPETRHQTEQRDSGGYRFPPPPPDRDCSQVSAHDFRVRPGDPHRFDSDGDGIGCES